MPRLLSLCLITAFAVVAAACGANPVPADDVANAGANTTAAGTARIETVIRFAGPSPTDTYELQSIGVVDYANGSSEYRMEPTGCRIITVGDVLYYEFPSDEEHPAGKRWMKVDGDVVDGEAAFEQSQNDAANGEIRLTTYGFSSTEPAPDEYLDYLRETSGEPERVGEEDVRGVATTRYRSTIDVRDVMRQELETAGWKAVNIEGYLEGIDGVQEIDVWIDSDGLVRRIVNTDNLPGTDEELTGGWVTTTEYFDFGLEVKIQPPPATELMEEVTWQIDHDEVTSESMDALELEAAEESELLPGGWHAYPPDESYDPPRCLP